MRPHLLPIVLALACDSSSAPAPAKAEPAPAKAEPAPAKAEPAPAKAEPAPAKTEPAPVKAEPVPTPEAPAADEPLAAVEEGGEPVPADAPIPAPTSAAEVAVTEITAMPTTVTWREVTRPAEAVTFEPTTRGILGRSAGGWLDVDKSGALVLRAEIEAPKGPVIGAWPDSAWVVERRVVQPNPREPERHQTRLVRVRGAKRWVPQMYGDTQRFEDHGQHFAIGGKGGMLVQTGCTPIDEEPAEAVPEGCDANELHRISDTVGDPIMGATIDGALVGFFESDAGELHTARRSSDAVYVQRDCADATCVAEQARKLPLGTAWTFGQSVTRGKHSVSVPAKADTAEGAKAHVLHYETGGWKLEALPQEPAGLWPTKDGGVWTLAGAQLWHRDPSGTWREITLPEGASSVSAAMSGDASELWIAADVGGSPVVFATAAKAQTPPAPDPAPAP